MATLTTNPNSGYYINDSLWQTMYVYSADSSRVLTYYYTNNSSLVGVEWLGQFDTIHGTGNVSQVNIYGLSAGSFIPIASLTPTVGLDDAGVMYRDISSGNYTHLFSYIFMAADYIAMTNYSDRISTYGGNDTVYGNYGDDFINTGAGDDSVEAGNGFDTVYGGVGNDYIQGGFNGDRLYGEDGNDDLRGGNGLDSINGGAGNDTIRGAKGTDTLTGGSGADDFVFATELDGVINIDTITDFTSGVDRIELSVSVFTALAGQIGRNVGLSQNITYNASNGNLSYDADGSGPSAPIVFAVLGTTSHPTSVGTDFWVTA